MIREMDSSGGGASAVELFNKLTEVIRALNAMEEANSTTNIGSAFASQMPCSPCTASRGIQNCDGHFGSSSCAVCITRLFAHA